MAVTSPWNARSALRLLIGDQPIAAGQILHDPYLPSQLLTAGGQPLRMTESEPIGGYGGEHRYVFPPDVAALIAGPADEAENSADLARRDAYVKASIDLTMQGGTTSGVVYPLAVCELATRFRFRNVGGASAGAIAAAFTAAAELGRSESMRGNTFASSGAPPTGPVLRRGFTGIADVMAWLTQTAPADGNGPDQFRLAQLFRPGGRTRPVFRVLLAAMRGRTWPLPLLALFAFGPLTMIITIVMIIGAIAAAGWTGRQFVRATEPWYVTILWGVAELLAYTLTVISVVLLAQTALAMIKRRRIQVATRATDGSALGLLRGFTSGGATPKPPWLVGLIAGLVLLCLAISMIISTPWRYLGALAVGLAGSFLVIFVLIGSVWVFIANLGDQQYGLIAGTEPMHTRSPLDRLAKAPRPTVAPSLVPWLSQSLSQLAGLGATEVLRFGHLWDGIGYVAAGAAASESDLARWRDKAELKDRRLVNLELMTTDLTRQRPYRFPLRVQDQASEPLFLQLDDLAAAQVFPDEVIAALRQSPYTSATINGQSRQFHRLPDPWDLPVVFAVRLSMALPGLFEAVRMYRIRWDTPIKDDFGRDLSYAGVPLTSITVDDPLQAATLTPVGLLAEELWFSDGGITSNFPVHFFDASLPRWPTVSLNLGGYPASEPTQDVWLPQDWDPVPLPVAPLERSGLSLPLAVLNTAMSWRDNMQSAMPGYRNRIAQVRIRSDEGGTNLFMTRETIASMALRGALAGARLRTRFGDAEEWNRFRWLRLRTAVSNLERYRGDTAGRADYYAQALHSSDWLADAQTRFLGGTPPPAGLSWFEPTDGFWPSAAVLLNQFAAAYTPGPVDVLTHSAPLPEPQLRQAPRE